MRLETSGKKAGHIIKAIISKSLASPFGELNGSVTPRLKRLIHIFRQAGLKAKSSTCIIDFLMTHGVGVPLIGKLLIKHELDNGELAESTADLKLFIDAIHESFKVLTALGYRIVPKGQYLIKIIPRFILLIFFRFFFKTKLAEVGAVYHVSQAPDEIDYLANELEELVKKSELPAPAIRKILAFNKEKTAK